MWLEDKEHCYLLALNYVKNAPNSNLGTRVMVIGGYMARIW